MYTWPKGNTSITSQPPTRGTLSYRHLHILPPATSTLKTLSLPQNALTKYTRSKLRQHAPTRCTLIYMTISTSVKINGMWNEWIEEWMDGCMNEWINSWMNAWMVGRMNEWMNERVNKWKHKWMIYWMNGWMNEWMKELINEWMNGLMNELEN